MALDWTNRLSEMLYAWDMAGQQRGCPRTALVGKCSQWLTHLAVQKEPCRQSGTTKSSAHVCPGSNYIAPWRLIILQQMAYHTVRYVTFLATLPCFVPVIKWRPEVGLGTRLHPTRELWNGNGFGILPERARAGKIARLFDTRKNGRVQWESSGRRS